MDKLNIMFKGVNHKWKQILLHESCRNELLQIVQTLKDEKNITPKWEHILEFAKFPLLNSKALMIGQDPYPTPGDAHGLSFSSLAEKTPASLQRIFTAWLKFGLIDKRPKNNDLRYLARQGILLMNVAWTTTLGTAGAHMNLWRPYTTKVFKLLNEHVLRPLVVCLWGSFAQECADLFPKHDIQKWCHPVAMVKPSFSECPHFKYLSEKYPELKWDQGPVTSRWYTDGSCKNNQNPRLAQASWGVVCKTGPFKDKTFGGKLPLTEKIISEGKEIDARPTNIRAEGLALITVLEKIYYSGLDGEHTVCSDSKFWIQDMLDTHIPEWVENNIPFTKKKNSDLVTKMWDLYNKCLKMGLKFKFVNAWHDYDCPEDVAGKADWEGNRDAEKVAEANLT